MGPHKEGAFSKERRIEWLSKNDWRSRFRCQGVPTKSYPTYFLVEHRKDACNFRLHLETEPFIFLFSFLVWLLHSRHTMISSTREASLGRFTIHANGQKKVSLTQAVAYLLWCAKSRVRKFPFLPKKREKGPSISFSIKKIFFVFLRQFMVCLPLYSWSDKFFASSLPKCTCR